MHINDLTKTYYGEFASSLKNLIFELGGGVNKIKPH